MVKVYDKYIPVIENNIINQIELSETVLIFKKYIAIPAIINPPMAVSVLYFVLISSVDISRI